MLRSRKRPCEYARGRVKRRGASPGAPATPRANLSGASTCARQSSRRSQGSSARPGAPGLRQTCSASRVVQRVHRGARCVPCAETRRRWGWGAVDATITGAPESLTPAPRVLSGLRLRHAQLRGRSGRATHCRHLKPRPVLGTRSPTAPSFRRPRRAAARCAVPAAPPAAPAPRPCGGLPAKRRAQERPPRWSPTMGWQERARAQRREDVAARAVHRAEEEPQLNEREPLFVQPKLEVRRLDEVCAVLDAHERHRRRGVGEPDPDEAGVGHGNARARGKQGGLTPSSLIESRQRRYQGADSSDSAGDSWRHPSRPPTGK